MCVCVCMYACARVCVSGQCLVSAWLSVVAYDYYVCICMCMCVCAYACTYI